MVSCGFIAMYYCFLFSQALIKLFLYHFTSAAATKDGKKISYGQFKYESSSKLNVTLDRFVLNDFNLYHFS